MLRKTVIILILAIMTCGSAFAQKNKDKSREEMRKELREFKIKFMAQEMDLKEDQQKQFIEVYGKMSDERMQLFEKTKRLEHKIKKEGDASEEEYAKVSKALTEAKEKDTEIEKRYDAEFSKFLSSKQIFLMKSAEEKFRQKMSEMRHKNKSKR